MKTYNYSELQTLTPELGLFVVTGATEDVLQAARSFVGCKNVSESTFSKVAYGRPRRRLVGWF